MKYKLRVFVVLSIVFAAGTLWAARQEPGNLPDPRTRAYPHIAWARNYEGGKPRVLFIAVEMSTWDIYELAMRMDMDYDVFYTIRPGQFAPTTDYYHEGVK